MKPEIKKLWVAALRSGEYQQGTGRCMNNATGWCCLGVLSDLHAKENGETWIQNPSPVNSDVRLYMGSAFYPPAAVREWADFHEDEKRVSIEGAKASVAVHNDGVGVPPRSFREIADAIEAQL
jgi:hypothetical protein